MLEEDPHESAARWLQEVGRRRVASAASSESVVVAPRARKALVTRGRHLALFAALAVSFLQYYFLDVALRISTLPANIYFVSS